MKAEEIKEIDGLSEMDWQQVLDKCEQQERADNEIIKVHQLDLKVNAAVMKLAKIKLKAFGGKKNAVKSEYIG